MKADGVAPLKPSDRVARPASSEKDRVNVQARRQAAALDRPLDEGLTTSEVPPVGPHDVVEFSRDGVQHGVWRKFRQGQYLGSARLDLHRHTVEEAREALLAFVRDCREHDVRCGLVMHGKGLHSKEENLAGRKPARLKSYVVYWLKEIPEVVAFCSAQPRDGGVGAVYVLFRKTEKMKEANRRLHGR